MCTVTFVPLGKTDYIFTSNRDESPMRRANAPDFHLYKDKLLLYPEDVESEGTWIGMNKDQRLVCVLNGGFEAHQRRAFYAKSRGIVAKDILIANDLHTAIEAYDLTDIEPFTMIIVESEGALQCFELVWDGVDKHFRQVESSPQIWSSSTLYDKDMREEREKWFEDHLNAHHVNLYSMYVFHTTAGKGNSEYGVIMDRTFVKTTSITQVEKTTDEIIMRFYDLDTNTQYHKFLNPKHTN